MPSATSSSETLDNDGTAADRQRGRLLRALVLPAAEAEPARLQRLATDHALVTTADDEELLLVSAPAGEAGLAELARALEALAERVGRAAVHVVVVGGGADTFEVLRTATLQRRGRPGLVRHQVDESWRYRSTALALPTLARAAARAEAARGAEAEPLSPDEAEAVRQRDAAANAEQERFAAQVRRSRPLVTYGIAAALGALFGLEVLFGGGSAEPAYLAMGANLGSAVREGDWYRPLASAFLHGNLVHLAFNTMALLSIAPLLEGLLGGWRFSLLYVACALAGGALSAAVHPQVVSLGASGAVWGLMGAAAALALLPRGLMPRSTATRMRRRLAMPLLINLGCSLLPGIDLFAHLGGGLAGFALFGSGALTAGLAQPTGAAQRRAGPGWTVAGGVAWLAVAAALSAALLAGRPWELSQPQAWVRRALAGTPLSLEVPARLRPRPAAAPPAFEFGRLDLDPVLLEVLVSAAVPEAERERVDLEALRASLAEVESGPGRLAGPPSLMQLGDRRIIARRIDYPGGTRRLDRIALVDDRLVAVRGYCRASSAAAWCEPLVERVLQSARGASER